MVSLLLIALPAHADPFADEVVSFTPGLHAGFGQDQLPGIALGPPRGSGDLAGSLDVVSFGDGGSIILAFRDSVICDGPGPDFTVFENAFLGGGTTAFTEVGIVAVSSDGEHFVELPYDANTLAGLAGRTPVYSNPDNGIDPTDPTVSGGDSFDLATVGLTSAVYVRITDPGAAIDDLGNHVPAGDNAGFDLDAIAAIHACATPPASPTPTDTPTPTSSPTPLATAAASPSHTRRSMPTATATASPRTDVLPGDADGDGDVDADDRSQTIREMFDGDGDAAANAGGGLVPSSPGVDANGDGLVSGADLMQRPLLTRGAPAG